MSYGTEALYWRLTPTNNIRSREAARRYELNSAVRRQLSSRHVRTPPAPATPERATPKSSTPERRNHHVPEPS